MHSPYEFRPIKLESQDQAFLLACQKFIDYYNIMTWGIYVSGKDPLMEGKTISNIADFCPPNHNL